jgi:recombination protein RecA
MNNVLFLFFFLDTRIKFGKGAIMRLGVDAQVPAVETISTGSLMVDIALGVGGCRAAASSRSTGRSRRARPRSALHIVAEAQKRGGVCGYIDAEHAMDVGYAKQAGRAHRRPAHLPARHRRAGLEIADMLVRSGAIDVWSSTRSPRWCPRPSSKAKWATRTWACRRA